MLQQFMLHIIQVSSTRPTIHATSFNQQYLFHNSHHIIHSAGPSHNSYIIHLAAPFPQFTHHSIGSTCPKVSAGRELDTLLGAWDDHGISNLTQVTADPLEFWRWQLHNSTVFSILHTQHGQYYLPQGQVTQHSPPCGHTSENQQLSRVPSAMQIK